VVDMTTKKRPSKRAVAAAPLFFVRPGATQSAEELADDIARFLIAQINEYRKAKGLPPMPKKS
jgi:hypothetical protein